MEGDEAFRLVLEGFGDAKYREGDLRAQIAQRDAEIYQLRNAATNRIDDSDAQQISDMGVAMAKMHRLGSVLIAEAQAAVNNHKNLPLDALQRAVAAASATFDEIPF